MTWHKTLDGSIEDENQRVVFFSRQRFVDDICLGRCCFICGARPGSKEFNDEHVIPDWLLRRFGLFDRTINLPNATSVRYSQYKVPCCRECNSLMGRQVEERVSAIINAGVDAVQESCQNGRGLEFFVWLGLLFLKTHLKDRDYRVHLDRRKREGNIGDAYDWETLHHLHCLVRCFVNGAKLEKEVFGSMGVFATKSEPGGDQFDYGDIFDAQTMMIRLDHVALVATFNDACGAIQGAMPRLDRIEGPLSQLQAREVMVDFAFMNMSLKERPKFYTDVDIRGESLTEKAVMPKQFRLVDTLDFTLRGALLRLALGESLERMSAVGKTKAEVEKALDEGVFTLLFDDNGQFIKDGIVPPEKSPA